jgi:parvulin-like peptidyl-prolyl isomerase
MSKTVNDHIKKEKKNYFMLIVPVLLIVVVILFQRIYPEREALNGLKGDYLIITETVYDNEYKLFSLEQKLELDEKNIRVYDNQYRLVRKITEYSFSDELRINNYRYSGREVYVRYQNSNDELSHNLDESIDNLTIEIQPIRDSVLFGELVIWDIDDYPIGVDDYRYDNNRYEVVGKEKPFPVTIVYYNGYGYPIEKTVYWSRGSINGTDSRHRQFRYKYDSEQRLIEVSEYRGRNIFTDPKEWYLEKVHTFTYQNKTIR